MKKNILISGGTGLVGKELTKIIDPVKYEIAYLSRSIKKDDINTFVWDYERQTIDNQAIEFADVIIHLAGENVSGNRWSEKQKAKILDSRIKTTDLLYKTIEKSGKTNIKIISASAIGYYGAVTSEKIFNEEDAPGSDFLAKVCIAWEDSVKKFNHLELDYNILRFGVVISKNGGAFVKLSTPVKYGIGSPIGSGKQYIPWVEISDVAGIIMFVIENEFKNQIFNVVAPDTVTNEEMIKKIAKSQKKPILLPSIPEWFMNMIFGEMAEILTKGSRISSDKLLAAGYKFNYKTFDEVLKKYYK